MGSTVVGVDVGATLAKLAVREPGGALRFDFVSARAVDELSRRVRDLAPRGVGLTGCGAGALAPHLESTPHRLGEFEAWARGSRTLLRAQAVDVDVPYLLVSLGTGTSMLRIDPEGVRRVGGTALGGGTLLGLGAALTGCASHPELCALASRGRRDRVDLLIEDLYGEDGIDLPGRATAAAFGKLARRRATPGPDAGGADEGRPEEADLAAAVMGLVGENVALIACGAALREGLHRVVFGGATLLGNAPLQALLCGVTAARGLEPLLLDEAGYAGALGALEHASSAAT